MGSGLDSRVTERADTVAYWVRRAGSDQHGIPGERIDPMIATSLCLVEDGWLLRNRRLPDGRVSTNATYLPGDIIGLDVWAGAPATDRITALTPVRVACRPLTELADELPREPALATDLLRRMAQDAALLREALAAVGRLNASERLLTFLAQTHRRLAANGIIAAQAERFDMPMTQGQLADLIGMTHIHVNRVLGALRREGVLRLTRGVVEIEDWAAFSQGDAALASA